MDNDKPQTDNQGPKRIFVGYWAAPGVIDNVEQMVVETYHGFSEESVMLEMCRDFAAEAFDKHPAAPYLQQHLSIEGVMGRFRIAPARIKEVAEEIRSAAPEQLKPFSQYFTPTEILRGYQQFNKDESIEIVAYAPERVTSFSALKPAQIEVLHFDHDAGMAITRDGEALVGYYQKYQTDAPHPDDYEWDNGFDFDFITPDQAEAITKAGYPEIVERFENSGAVCDG